MCLCRLSRLGGVGVAVCKDILALHIDPHKVGFEVHTLVRYVAIAIAVNQVVAGIKYH